jgi:hypothetical protein
MLLIISNKKDETTNYLCRRLEYAKFDFFRFDTDSQITSLRIGFEKEFPFIENKSRKFLPSDFNCVWFRRPTQIHLKLTPKKSENLQISHEWTEAFENFFSFISPHKWINYPAFNSLAQHKLEQLSRAKKFGLTIPDTVLTMAPQVLKKFWKRNNGEIIVKPLASGYLEGKNKTHDASIYTNKVKLIDLKKANLLENCPTLFQNLISKDLDVRLTIIDRYVDAVGLKYREADGSQRVDIRRNNMVDVEYSKIVVPPMIRKKILDLMKSYNLRFSAIDMVIDKFGKWYFLEINPNGQWAWLDLLGITDIASSFLSTFKTAQK